MSWEPYGAVSREFEVVDCSTERCVDVEVVMQYPGGLVLCCSIEEIDDDALLGVIRQKETQAWRWD